MASPVIAPSILAADYTKFGKEAKRAELAGGDWLHVDIMDGHFVPNISFGPAVTAALKSSTRLPLDVHLMIQKPDQYVDAFLKAGAYRITVHVEAEHDIKTTLRRIRKGGCRAGIALNPSTDCSRIEKYLEDIDLVLCMTVVPGFGGQKFMSAVLGKVSYLANYALRRRHRYYIEVDGGIDVEAAVASAKAGADVFVAGTSLFSAKNMKSAISQMRRAVLAVD